MKQYLGHKIITPVFEEPKAQSPARAEDFSYEYYRRILRTVKDNFTHYVVAAAPQAIQANGKRLIMRHDVDVSLHRALDMACVERQAGFVATYMIIPNALLYSIEDDESVEILQEILSLGHEVGLHFDLSESERKAMFSIESMTDKIESACVQLELALGGTRVRSISFHRPTAEFLSGPLWVAGRVNAYAKEIFSAAYLSDSKGAWRSGEPVSALLSPGMNVVQLLTHPIWWGDQNLSASERLEQYFRSETQGRPPEAVAHFDNLLTMAVPGVTRRGKTTISSEVANDTGKV
jgi:hypothetical protein